MSSQHIQATLPGFTTRRPAGSLRAVALQRLQRLGHGIWAALEQLGQRRSDRELLARAESCKHTNPKRARELRSYVRGGSSY